jgi:hypothetical protein
MMKRPPRKWMKRCIKGVSAHSAQDPAAVCGSLWYHKMSPAAKRKAMREENPPCASCAVPLQANPSGGTVFLLVAGGIGLLWLLWPKKKEELKVDTSLVRHLNLQAATAAMRVERRAPRPSLHSKAKEQRAPHASGVRYSPGALMGYL